MALFEVEMKYFVFLQNMASNKTDSNKEAKQDNLFKRAYIGTSLRNTFIGLQNGAVTQKQ